MHCLCGGGRYDWTAYGGTKCTQRKIQTHERRERYKWCLHAAAARNRNHPELLRAAWCCRTYVGLLCVCVYMCARCDGTGINAFRIASWMFNQQNNKTKCAIYGKTFIYLLFAQIYTHHHDWKDDYTVQLYHIPNFCRASRFYNYFFKLQFV